MRRAIVTGVNQTAGQLQEELADELGCDLVEVSAHAGARPEHAKWQGKIYSRSGNDPKYPDFKKSTGYGTGAGLCGWNCRHTFGPYIDGSPPVWPEEQLAELDAPKYEYGGKKLTEYEVSQQQRYNERQIRRWKREEAAMRAAGQDSSEASAKVKEWQGRQQEFLAQTGFKRQYGREQIAVANFENRGIINAQDKVNTRITEESFLRLIDCIPTNRAEDERNRLQDAATALLTEARKIDGGRVEFGSVYSSGFKEMLWSGRGEKHSVGVSIFDVPHIVLHTHPNCRTFSETDINHFLMNESVEEIIAIGNDGSFFSLRKTEQFIASDFVLAFAELFRPDSYVYESRDIYAKAMSDFLKEATQYGVEYFERSAKSS